MSAPAQAVSPELAQALEDLRKELREVRGGSGNPVGAARALQWVAAQHHMEFQGQRQAFRWEAEKILRPFFRDLDPEQAAKAVVWLALDAAWAGGGSRGS